MARQQRHIARENKLRLEREMRGDYAQNDVAPKGRASGNDDDDVPEERPTESEWTVEERNAYAREQKHKTLKQFPEYAGLLRHMFVPVAFFDSLLESATCTRLLLWTNYSIISCILTNVHNKFTFCAT